MPASRGSAVEIHTRDGDGDAPEWQLQRLAAPAKPSTAPAGAVHMITQRESQNTDAQFSELGQDRWQRTVVVFESVWIRIDVLLFLS